MISLNLLPDVKLEYIRTKRLQAKVISAAIVASVIAVGLVVLMAVWVYGAQTIHKNILTGQIEEKSKELKAIPDIDKYLTLQNQLTKLSSLHAGKSDFSRLMDYLPALNPAAPQNVTITNMEVTSEGELGNTIAFRGEVSNYNALNIFRDTLLNAELSYGESKEKLFESVVVSSSALAVDDKNRSLVTFTIDTVFNPNAFLSSTESPKVSVPKLNTTQSAQAAPDVFGSSSVRGGE